MHRVTRNDLVSTLDVERGILVPERADHPLIEVWRATIVGPLVEVLPEDPRAVAGVLEDGGQGPPELQPFDRVPSILVDGVIVRIAARQDRGAGRAAKRGSGVGVRELGSLFAEPLLHRWEHVHRPFGALVVRDEDQDVGTLLLCRARLRHPGAATDDGCQQGCHPRQHARGCQNHVPTPCSPSHLCAFSRTRTLKSPKGCADQDIPGRREPGEESRSRARVVGEKVRPPELRGPIHL